MSNIGCVSTITLGRQTKTKPLFSAILLVTSIVFQLSLYGCSKGCRNSPSDSSDENIKIALPKAGRPIFLFDYETATELFVTKTQSEASGPWSARVSKDSNRSAWKVDLAPDGQELSDTVANSTYIAHLLDTLTTLNFVRLAKKGTLHTYGLDPPLYALKWKNDKKKEFQIEFGQVLPDGKGAYARIPGHPVIVVNGATLKMLAHLRTFQNLRLQKLLNFSQHEVTDIDVVKNNKSIFHAHRQSGEWGDIKNRIHQFDVDSWLTNFFHIRIAKYFDNREKSSGLNIITSKSGRGVDFKDRHGQVTRLRVLKRDGEVYGTLTSRPKSVFYLYPSILDAIDRRR